MKIFHIDKDDHQNAYDPKTEDNLQIEEDPKNEEGPKNEEEP